MGRECLLSPGAWHVAGDTEPSLLSLSLKQQSFLCQISAEVGILYPSSVFYVRSFVVSTWIRSLGLLNTKFVAGQL